MTIFARFAAGTALSLSALAIAATPAMAQEKPKKQKAEKPVSAKFSAGFRKASPPADAAYQAVKAANAEVDQARRANDAAAKTAAEAKAKAAAEAARPLIATAEAAAVDPDDKLLVGQWKYDVAIATNDAAGARAALGLMLDSNSTLLTSRSALVAQLGSLAYQDKDYAQVVQRLGPLQESGELSAQNMIFLADSYFKTGDKAKGFAAAKAAIEKEKAAGRKADASWYNVARREAVNAKLVRETGEWSRMLARDHPSVETWHDGIAYQINTAGLRDADRADMFRLMLASGAMINASEYREFVDLLTRLKLPGEANSVLDDGVRAGKLNESDRLVVEQRAALRPLVAADKASLGSAEAGAKAAPTGRVAANWGNAFYGYRDYAKAVTFYELALSKGGVEADDINLRLGQALLGAGRKADAIAAFDKVAGTNRETAQFWRFYAETKA